MLTNVHLQEVQNDTKKSKRRLSFTWVIVSCILGLYLAFLLARVYQLGNEHNWIRSWLLLYYNILKRAE